MSDAEALAAKVGEVLDEGDFASGTLGITLLEIGPGRAVLCLDVTKPMLNAGGLCHGGIIFTLGDTSFAYASCSHGMLTVSQQANINWIKGARQGDRLTATCTEVALAGKSGIYDVLIVNQDGDTIAVMRGLTRTINQPAIRE